ncbi:Kelch repeat-containing protein [Devosia aurantiaca]|uniref:Kelch repeat-containing protein n=1 Tax=Devosia aurantiaca TaxID=2714858 RepID=UPI001F166DB8|nr:kelch repeat-containing protein [Devosia aurantiaca]
MTVPGFCRNAVFVSLLLGTLTLPALAHEVGAWAGLSDAPAERSEVAVASMDGKAYVVGDFNGETDLMIFDMATESWAIAAPFPYPVHHAAAAAQGGLIYVFGGYVNGWDVTGEVWAYDPQSNTWTPRAPMPTPRAAGAAATIGGKIHVVSGSDVELVNSTAHEVYDPASDSWSIAAPIPTPRDHLAVGVIHGQLIAAGGRVNGDPAFNLAATEVFDPQSNSWSSGEDMPTARSGTASAVLDGAMFVIGGESRTEVFDAVEAYILANDTWQQHAPLPTARHGFGAAAYEDRIFTLLGSPSPAATVQRRSRSSGPDRLPIRFPRLVWDRGSFFAPHKAQDFLNQLRAAPAPRWQSCSTISSKRSRAKNLNGRLPHRSCTWHRNSNGPLYFCPRQQIC